MLDGLPDRRLTVEDLKTWHRQWLGNVYAWAGDERSVNMSKGDFMFATAGQIPRLFATFEKDCLTRWTPCHGLTDGRPDAVRPIPAHALTPAEQEQIVSVANEPRFADMPPARIVPMLADEGQYIASEASFQRVLRAQWQTRHRGRAKAPRQGRPPSTHVATAPRQLWSWD